MGTLVHTVCWWGQAHWATVHPKKTEDLCSLECSLILTLDLWPDWDPKLGYCKTKMCHQIRIKPILGKIMSALDVLKVPSWLWLISVLFEHFLSSFKQSVCLQKIWPCHLKKLLSTALSKVKVLTKHISVSEAILPSQKNSKNVFICIILNLMVCLEQACSPYISKGCG